jgi:hypothetical protein
VPIAFAGDTTVQLVRFPLRSTFTGPVAEAFQLSVALPGGIISIDAGWTLAALEKPDATRAVTAIKNLERKKPTL